MLTIRWPVLRSVLKEAWPVGLAIGGAVLAGIQAWIVGRIFFESQRPDVVLYMGMALELFGLGTVALGLWEARRSFGRPPLTSAATEWFRRAASAFQAPQPSVFNMLGNSASLFVSGHAPVSRGGPLDTSVEGRLSVIEGKLAQLSKELSDKVEELRKADAAVSEQFGRERGERLAGDREIACQLEGIAIGGLRLEAAWLFWLFLGVFLTSIPDKIAGWF